MTPGTDFGPYQVLGLLGTGGMGEVYRARDPRLGREVAIKILPEKLAGSAEFAERFQREGRFLASVSHPNVAGIYGVENHDGVSSLVLELVDGPMLGDWVSAEQRPIEDLLRVARQIAAALDAAHRQGIVHRDLKPSNVRIAQDGTAKVLDFGLARTVAAADDVSDTILALTSAGTVLGTPGYLAPEQAAGAAADARSDVWGFGALLFEMLARRPAFVRGSLRETLTAVLTARVPWEDLPAGVPASVRSLLEGCLSIEPKRRPLDGAALCALLDACPQGPVHTERPPSLLVLPFASLGTDAENQAFAEGLTEEVIADLANIGGLRVFSRATARRYHGERRDAAMAARELSAGYVLDGAVRRAGESVRVTVQLLQASHDAPVWAEKYAGTLADVFAMQEQVSRAIASALSLQLSAKGVRRFAEARRWSVAAYDAYLSTRADVDSFALSRLDGARARLERALDEIGPDPYLYRGLGRVAWQYVNAGLSRDPAHFARLDDCIQRLDALDPYGSHALALRAMRAMISGDVVAWYRALQRVESADPADTEMRLWQSMLLSFVGRTEVARAVVDRVAELDPFNELVAFARYLATLLDGHFVDARRIGERNLEERPGSAGWPAWLAQTLGMTGDRDAARAMVAARIPDPRAGGVATLAHVFVAALWGDRATVLDLMTPEFEQLMWNDFQYCHMVAQSHALLGQNDEAVRWLGRAVERGFLHHRFFRATDPLLAPLRGSEAFEALCDRAELAAEQFPA